MTFNKYLHALPAAIFAMLIAALALSCKKWDLEKETFLEVTTLAVVAQTYTSVTIEGEISGLAGSGKIDQHGLAWSYTNSDPTILDEVKEEGDRSQDGKFQSELTDLAVNEPIYARAFARSGTRIAYGEVIQVQPILVNLSITMDSIRTDNASSNVTIYGRVKGLPAGLSFIAHGFVWSTENELPELETDFGNFLGPVNNSDLIMEDVLYDLEPLKTHYVRVFVISGSRAIYSSNVLSFSTGNVWRRMGAFPLDDATIPKYHFTIEDQLYVAFNQGFGIFDPANFTWEPKSSNYPDIGEAGTFSIDQEGYVGAGWPVQGKCWKYSAPTDDWTEIADHPTTGTGSLGFSVGGKGYIGLNREPSSGVFNKNIYRYEPAADQWQLETTSDPPVEIKSGYVSFQFEDHVAIGMAFFATYSGFWSYYPSSGTWTQNADFPNQVSVYESMSTFTIGNKGYLILPGESDNFWEYNSSTDSWRQRADFPDAPRNFGLTFSLNGKGYHGLGNLFNYDEQSSIMWEYIPDPD